jgi:hypothetical protein
MSQNDASSRVEINAACGGGAHSGPPSPTRRPYRRVGPLASLRLCASFCLLLGAMLLGACGSGGTTLQTCTDQTECPAGWLCVDGACRASDAGGDSLADDGAADADADADGTDDGAGADGDADASCEAGTTACGGTCCTAAERCREGACLPDLGTCATDDDCWSDSWCEAGVCVPYGVPPGHVNDTDCSRPIDIDAIAPDVQCRWTGPPDGDAAPNHVHVMSTPVVVDFDFDGDPATLAPSIVFTTFPTAGSYSNPGVLRIIDGTTCAQQASFPAPEDATMSPASVALGDLDADGRAEIVAAAHGGGLLAFRYDAATATFARWWRSGTCDASGGRTPDTTGGADQWSGPSIHDLDDDGVPEIVYGATVYAADGCIRSSTYGYPAYHKGIVPVVADVDEDGGMELVLGNALYAWDPTVGDLVPETYFVPGTLAAGQVAVADFGSFPLASFGGADRAEVAVISTGYGRVQTLEGTVVFGPVALPGGGSGGLPTIADFDGDGRREFASAGGANYVVFDLDCVEGGGTGTCASARTDGILWTQPSKDLSSNVTGSSVFDFDANGSAEAVYADECFLRIYEGSDGRVVFSAARSSGTTYENPVIVDVDGDFHAEIVSAVNDYAGTNGCPATDPLLPATAFAVNHGIVVLRDILDRWAASRPVWSQHAYAVTHVGNRGEIPRSSAVPLNWRDPGLNNFRQNVQGDLDALGVPDLTAGAEAGPVRLPCVDGVGALTARVCNRGLLPFGGGTVVSFRRDAPDGPELCHTIVLATIDVGACVPASCDAALPSSPIDVYVVADPDDAADECLEANNVAILHDVQCEIIG